MFQRVVDRLEEGVLSLLLVGMTLLVFYEVVMRFGFGAGVLWAQEATLHLSAWFVLFGASYGVKKASHIGVDAVVRLLPPAGQKTAGLLAVALCLVYCGLFLYGAWEYLKLVRMIGIELEDIPIKKWIAHSILFIGFVLLAVRFLEVGWSILIGRTAGFELADEGREVLEQSKILQDAKAEAAERLDDARDSQPDDGGPRR